MDSQQTVIRGFELLRYTQHLGLVERLVFDEDVNSSQISRFPPPLVLLKSN